MGQKKVDELKDMIKGEEQPQTQEPAKEDQKVELANQIALLDNNGTFRYALLQRLDTLTAVIQEMTKQTEEHNKLITKNLGSELSVEND